MTTRNDIRKAFKAIGYKAGFKRNPMNDNICNVTFQDTEGTLIKPVIVSQSNIVSKEFYDKHKPAFDLAVSFSGVFLEDTEQKIV